MEDLYQVRYLEHQARKRALIESKQEMGDVFNVLQARRSQRVFNTVELTEMELNHIYEAIRLAPSSCNRQAILVRTISSTAEKRCLDRLLVGGYNWLANAATVLLLFADMLAYKSPAEIDFMLYLDAGFVGENVYLAAEVLGIGACFVNPHIRADDRPEFDYLFNSRSHLFCGAMALGKYNVRAPRPPKRTLEEIFYR